MSDLHETLARVQERIVETDLRVSAQITRIEWMVEKGYNIAIAKAVLQELERTLEEWHVRRRLILEAIALVRG